MKKEQNYNNHRRLSPFDVLSLLILIVVFVSIVYMFNEDFALPTIMLSGLSLSLLVLNSLVGRFTTRLQDRVILSEERTRHTMLTGQPIDPALTRKQIIALRFASDKEFPDLCQQAVEKQLRPDAIKKLITHWRADQLRI